MNDPEAFRSAGHALVDGVSDYLAELGLRAAGAPDPRADAPLLVATITGFMLGQLVTPADDFEERIFRPALERLFTKLTEPGTVTA